MTYWAEIPNIGKVSIVLKDRDAYMRGPGLIYTTKHNGAEYSIESQLAPESEEEDALIDMCQELHRKCLKLKENG